MLYSDLAVTTVNIWLWHFYVIREIVMHTVLIDSCNKLIYICNNISVYFFHLITVFYPLIHISP